MVVSNMVERRQVYASSHRTRSKAVLSSLLLTNSSLWKSITSEVFQVPRYMH